MELWLKISCLLCIFGFLREMRPSESYHTEYILGGWYNVTQEQLNRDVYPLSTYSHLALLIVVFLITDFLRYKPVIIANAITGIVIWSLLMWVFTLWGLQIVEFLFGFYQSAEVAYYSYIYAMVDQKYYPRVTAHTRAATFVGRLMAGLSAQILVSWKIMNYKELVYITLGCQILATCWACCLPPVEQSLYFHQKTSQSAKHMTGMDNSAFELDTKSKEAVTIAAATAMYATTATALSIDATGTTLMSTAKGNIGRTFQLLWLHFYSAYSNPMVLQWSLWYAVSLAGYQLVTTYVQMMWKSFENGPTIAWNGGVDAAATALAALFALFAGYLYAGRLKSHSSIILLATFSVLEGGCILLACWTSNVYTSYIGYVLFSGLYGFTITVASAELACNLIEDSFALIFGINTLIALMLQTALTVIVISESVLYLNSFQQFTVYAFYFIVIGIIYFITAVVQYALTRTKSVRK